MPGCWCSQAVVKPIYFAARSLSDPMKIRRFDPLIAWLILIWFGLTNTVLSGGFVVCRDGHGGVAIEWGCDRNAEGGCATACGDPITEEQIPLPYPCEDTPVAGESQVTHAPPRSAAELSSMIPALVAVLVVWADVSEPEATMCGCADTAGRPPDALTHFRTVVLVV